MKKKTTLRVKELRERAGLTTTQLADRLNMERTTVYKWESGENRPTVDTLFRLAEFFHCPVDDLFDRTPPGRDGERR